MSEDEVRVHINAVTQSIDNFLVNRRKPLRMRYAVLSARCRLHFSFPCVVWNAQREQNTFFFLAIYLL